MVGAVDATRFPGEETHQFRGRSVASNDDVDDYGTPKNGFLLSPRGGGGGGEGGGGGACGKSELVQIPIGGGGGLVKPAGPREPTSHLSRQSMPSQKPNLSCGTVAQHLTQQPPQQQQPPPPPSPLIPTNAQAMRGLSQTSASAYGFSGPPQTMIDAFGRDVSGAGVGGIGGGGVVGGYPRGGVHQSINPSVNQEPSLTSRQKIHEFHNIKHSSSEQEDVHANRRRRPPVPQRQSKRMTMTTTTTTTMSTTTTTTSSSSSTTPTSGDLSGIVLQLGPFDETVRKRLDGGTKKEL